MDAERTISGQKYRIGDLTPKEQFHVARRIAPIISDIAGAAVAALRAPGALDPDKMTEEAIGALLVSFAGGLGKMKNDEADYVIDTCLSACTRDQGNGQWAPVAGRQGGMMFADIKLPEMVQLVVAVVQENLGGFFPEAAPDKAPAAGTPA